MFPTIFRGSPCEAFRNFHLEKDDQSEEDINNIRKAIENGVKDPDSTQKTIRLAYHNCDSLPLATSTGQVDWSNDDVKCNKYTTPTDLNFRLAGLNGLHARYYNVNQRYDTTKEYTIKFITHTMPDIRKEFLFNNKLFVCKEPEYRLTREGIHPEVTGTFYEVK